MNGDGFVLYEEDAATIQEELGRFLSAAHATCVLLVHGSGQLVAERGFTRNLDTSSLAALAAGAFASTKEIARLIGEPEFSVLFHEGDNAKIHLSVVGPDAIMVTIFDNRTTLGMVRLCASEAAERLDRVFAQAGQREVSGEQAITGLPTGELFQEQQLGD